MGRAQKTILICFVALLLVSIPFIFSQQAIQKQIKKIPAKEILVRGYKIVMERVALESPQGMKIYSTQVLQVRTDLVERFVKEQGLIMKTLAPKAIKLAAKAVPPAQENIYAEKEQNFTRLVTNVQRGHMILLPKIEKISMVKVELLNKDVALRTALDQVNSLQLVPKDVSQWLPKHVVTLSKGELKQGQAPVISHILQTVHFQRTLDAKPVVGNGSQLFIELGNQGKLEGFTRIWNQIVPTSIKPEFRTDNEVYNDIEQTLKQQIKAEVTVQVKKPRLIYFGDDRKFVQPAYFYTAEITSPNAQGKAYYAGVVTALRNPPEQVLIAKDPKLRLLPKAAQATTASSPLAEDDPSVGRYVVRQDSWDWVDDANDFASGLEDGRCSGCTITFGDYYWDEPRVWTTEESFFVDKWHIALMEGHGDNWLFTTRSNCCDTVNLNSASQPGYGDRAGDSMRYLILKGCSIIPSPDDRDNWPDPWWRVFKGLRQAVGFRTSMYINDNICHHFGKHLGQNGQILNNWFHATNKCSSYQWERFWGSWGDEVYGYGCVVMIPGHEPDAIYNTAAAPPATSTGLTVWWQHD